MTLVEFLLERIAEDEAAARAHTFAAPVVVEETAGGPIMGWPRYTAERIIAECDAKRRIIELHGTDDAWCDYCSGHGHASSGCPTVRLLALPYRDHSDYRAEWAPESDR